MIDIISVLIMVGIAFIIGTIVGIVYSYWEWNKEATGGY
jgi:hypothetical protein